MHVTSRDFECLFCRVLLERLIVNRPHPWGLLITFIELIKNPQFKFWNHEFVHCAPEIEKWVIFWDETSFIWLAANAHQWSNCLIPFWAKEHVAQFGGCSFAHVFSKGEKRSVKVDSRFVDWWCWNWKAWHVWYPLVVLQAVRVGGTVLHATATESGAEGTRRSSGGALNLISATTATGYSRRRYCFDWLLFPKTTWLLRQTKEKPDFLNRYSMLFPCCDWNDVKPTG